MTWTSQLAQKNPLTGIAARRTPRRSYRRPVGVLLSGQYAVVEGRSLSEGGVLFSLKNMKNELRLRLDDFQVGARVAISLILPAGPVMVLRGVVIYHQDDSTAAAGPATAIGVKFDVVPILQRREIRTYVSQKRAGELDTEADAVPLTSKRL